MSATRLSLDSLDDIVAGVVEPQARQVDAEGTFPRQAVTALGEAGLLGLTSSAEVGGAGKGLREAAQVVEQLGRGCASTAMVVTMHYCAAAVIEAYGPRDVREAIAGGDHLSTLAFSEAGSRSHFWVPLGTAAQLDGTGRVALDASKSWVTSAGEADSYVWSSQPLQGDGLSTIWLVPAGSTGLQVAGSFDGLGLRGNASRPMSADRVTVDRAAMLGEDGAGFELMVGTVLPNFQVLNAAMSVGLMESAIAGTATHATATRFEHLGQSFADQPVVRLQIARMRVTADQARTMRDDTISAIESGRPDAQLRVLEVKAAASEAALAVTDTAMRVCGGSAFRKEVSVERNFRDARAASVMAPTTHALLDFIGKVECGMPLF
jgi:alkylation response protein AidB-like acyl-CoA dehydrogenase